MRQTVTVFSLTLVCLALLDVMVALTLGWAERNNRLVSLVRYFDYGLSVPGKLENWEANPDMLGNLYDVAWRNEIVAKSSESFKDKKDIEAVTVRTYGMSFVNNILKQALSLDSNIINDGHGGPSAPPNFTFALFEDDRGNRNPGDVVVLGVLSSSVTAMAALSNQTWLFEQPAPFTYPVYFLDGESLKRNEPLINSAEAHRDLTQNEKTRDAWLAQLRQDDMFFGPQTFKATWLDVVPFARLVRRSLAIDHIENTKRKIVDGAYPYEEVLQRMITTFAETAREDDQVPVVFLIQGRDPKDINLLDATEHVLKNDGIPYLATVEHYDPRNLSGFEADGHYKEDIDRIFGWAFVNLLSSQIHLQ